jgi:hypothetical protein
MARCGKAAIKVMPTRKINTNVQVARKILPSGTCGAEPFKANIV